jgi:hypothetical protein
MSGFKIINSSPESFENQTMHKNAQGLKFQRLDCTSTVLDAQEYCPSSQIDRTVEKRGVVAVGVPQVPAGRAWGRWALGSGSVKSCSLVGADGGPGAVSSPGFILHTGVPRRNVRVSGGWGQASISSTLIFVPDGRGKLGDKEGRKERKEGGGKEVRRGERKR